MDLTLSQLQTLKTWAVDIQQANPFWDENQIAAEANKPASPSYWVWKTSLGKHDVTDKSSIDVDGTTATNFVWGGASGGYINRTQGERDAWKEIFNSSLSCNPSRANVRTAFVDIFSGTGAGAVANRAHIWASGQRACTVGEKLFVTQTVGGPSQTGSRGAKTNPDTLGPEGEVTPQNIIDALSLA